MTDFLKNILVVAGLLAAEDGAAADEQKAVTTHNLNVSSFAEQCTEDSFTVLSTDSRKNHAGRGVAEYAPNRYALLTSTTTGTGFSLTLSSMHFATLDEKGIIGEVNISDSAPGKSEFINFDDSNQQVMTFSEVGKNEYRLRLTALSRSLRGSKSGMFYADFLIDSDKPELLGVELDKSRLFQDRSVNNGMKTFSLNGKNETRVWALGDGFTASFPVNEDLPMAYIAKRDGNKATVVYGFDNRQAGVPVFQSALINASMNADSSMQRRGLYPVTYKDIKDVAASDKGTFAIISQDKGKIAYSFHGKNENEYLFDFRTLKVFFISDLVGVGDFYYSSIMYPFNRGYHSVVLKMDKEGKNMWCSQLNNTVISAMAVNFNGTGIIASFTDYSRDAGGILRFEF